MSEMRDLVTVDTVSDGDGDKIEVCVLGPRVLLAVAGAGGAVLLDADGQERFAQAYVAACRQAMVNAETAKAVVTDGA